MADAYKLMMGIDLPITNEITLKHPKLLDVFSIGEEEYLQQVGSFVSTPSDLKVELDDMGINFENITEFELFCARISSFENTVIDKNLIDGFDFKYAQPLLSENNELCLFDPSHNSLLDEVHYLILCDYIREIHGFTKNVETYGNDFTRKMVIDIERDTRKHKAYKKFEPFLMDYVSGLINCSESKYDYHNVWDLPYYVFLDSVKRIQKVIQFKGFMTGIYSGMVDTKKINFEKMSWVGKLE